MKQLELFDNLPSEERQWIAIKINLPIGQYNRLYSHLQAVKSNFSVFIRRLIDKELNHEG